MIKSLCSISRSYNARLSGYVRHCSASSKTTHNNAAAVQPTSHDVRRTTFGQPTPSTHPHLLRSGHLNELITAEECAGRRRRVMESIQRFALAQDPSHSRHLVIVPSASKRYMSDKIPYVFRQNSDFRYLSGCLEEDTVLVMWIDDTKTTKSALFMRPKDAHAELWDGPRTGVEQAQALFKVELSFPIDELKSFIAKFPATTSLWFNQKTCSMTKVSNIMAEHLKDVALPKFVEAPTAFIHQQRIIKSAAEQQLMRHTCAIASQAINETMRETKPDDSEHHVFARVDYKCRMAGASFLAYPPVVASGRNATVIHYVQNSQRIADGDMILMDAGCEYGGYSSDITRTWPVTGRFTDPQRVLYEIVWLLQRELIATINRDGGRTLDALFDTMCLRLGQLLQEAGLLRRTLAGQDLARAAFRLCPHHVSHYLGMDVHDTPMISRQMPLRPGVVCTVEPGIYIGDDITDVPPEFRGLGIRIEDDVLILDEGEVEVLTDACVKDPVELETLVVGV